MESGISNRCARWSTAPDVIILVHSRKGKILPSRANARGSLYEPEFTKGRSSVGRRRCHYYVLVVDNDAVDFLFVFRAQDNSHHFRLPCNCLRRPLAEQVAKRISRRLSANKVVQNFALSHDGREAHDWTEGNVFPDCGERLPHQHCFLSPPDHSLSSDPHHS